MLTDVKECARIKKNARQRAWSAANIEKVRAHNRAYNLRPEVRARKRARYRLHREQITANRIKYEYGLTPVQHAQMLVEHGGRCAICRQARKLCIDHDHKTGRVRALLCHLCNTHLAWLENPKRVAKLVAMREYLREHGSLP